MSNLRLESLASPFHIGGLAIAEAAPLLDASGQPRLDEIRIRIERRLTRIPELRRRVYFPGLLQGRPLWMDDSKFDIRHHVLETRVAAPGGDAELLETTARILGPLLDRSRPLWELWFLIGLTENRIGVLLKLHHAVADGMAAIAIMMLLYDLASDAPDPDGVPRSPADVPGAWPLIADNLSTKAAALGHAVAAFKHPLRAAKFVAAFVRDIRQTLRERTKAPRTSINQIVRPGRRIRVVRLDLAAVKEQAHAAGGKVNDVVLDLVAGGLRELLIARGESIPPELTATVAVSLRSSAEARNLGNQVGVIAVPLPVSESDPRRRLTMIVSATREAKSSQHPSGVEEAVAWLAATPIAQRLMAHQRWVNVFTTNVVGPPVPVYVLGARILDVVPVTQGAGNVGLGFCAISYAGGLNLVVTADATAFPDVDAVEAGIERTWLELKVKAAGKQAEDGAGSR